MKQYLDLMHAITARHEAAHGVPRADRTGVGRTSVFGWQMRFDLNAGFPLVTTKKLHLRSIIHELLWFLKGGTDIAYLHAEGVTIWDQWALKEDIIETYDLSGSERVRLYADKHGMLRSAVETMLNRLDRTRDESMQAGQFSPGAAEFLDKDGIPRTGTRVTHRKGELGPVYGKQWRDWEGPDGKRYDQIAYVIDTLRNNPTSSRIVLTAWNPADLPVEKQSFEENLKNGKQALASCHCLVQFFAEVLSIEERFALLKANFEIVPKHFQNAMDIITYADIAEDVNEATEILNSILQEHRIPKHRLSSQLYQRSCDVFLGVPFNIASYALLTHMVAQVVGMTVGEFVWTGGDCHLYADQWQNVQTQLQREPMPLPKLLLNPAVTEIDQFTFDDIKIVGYNSHPALKQAVAV